MPNIFWCLHSHSHYLISKFCVLSCCSFSFFYQFTHQIKILFISFFHLQSFQFNLILQKLKRKNFCDMFSDNPPVTVTVRDRDLCGSDESWVREKHLLDDEIMKLSPIQASRFNIKIACRACQRVSCIKRKWKEAMDVHDDDDDDDDDDEGVPNKRLRGQQEAVSVQQNYSPCPHNTLHIVESAEEIIIDVEDFMSSLFTMDESIQTKQHSDEEEAFLVQQNQAIQLFCSNNILQTSAAFDVLSSLDGILEFDCTEDPGDQGVQNKQQRGDGVIELPCSNDILRIVEFEGDIESLPEDSLTFDDEHCLSIIDEILEHNCTEDPGEEGFQNKQQRTGKEALFVQQKQAIELSRSNDILKIVLLWMLLMIIH